MALLETTQDLERGPETGHFFYQNTEMQEFNPVGPLLQTVSENFWSGNSDLLGETGFDPGILLQYRKTNHGEVVPCDDGEGLPQVRTVQFQAQETGVYEWQLTTADRDGRTIDNLKVGAGSITATRTSCNTQGMVTASSELGVEEQHLAVTEILRALTSELMVGKVAELRERRQRVEQDIASFAIEGLHKYAAKKYDFLLAQKEKSKEKARFTPLGLYRA